MTRRTLRPSLTKASRLCMAIALLLGLLTVPLPAGATPAATSPAATITLNVDTTTDSNAAAYRQCTAAANDCSLRGAISVANASSVNEYIINVPAGVYTLTLAGASEDANATGDLDLNNAITINGAGAGSTIIDGNQLDRVFSASGMPESVVIDGVTITNGRTPNAEEDDCEGGGIHVHNATLTLRNSVVSGNTTGYHTGPSWTDMGCFGGGIYRDGTGALTIEDSVIRDNAAGDGNNSHGGRGGGLYVSGSVSILNSAITGNASGDGPGGNIHGYGGGVYVDGGTATILNSTLSGNTAVHGSGGGYGGGVRVGAGTLNLIHSTVTGNTGNSGGGLSNTSTASLKNSIIAGNDALVSGSDDCDGTITSLGYNLVGSGGGCPSGGTADQTTAAARLGPLQDNGGPTETHAPQYDSPAVGVIPEGVNGCGTDYTEDQRGETRPQGSACDVGAFETPYTRWDGGGADNNASTAANWSGDVAPGTSDVPVFFSLSSKNATIDGGLTVGGWVMDATYAGTISQGSSNLIVSGDWTQSGGTFSGGSGTLNLSGGAFTAPSGLMGVSGGFAHTGGAFDPNGGRVLLDNTTNQTLASTFHDLTINDGLIGYWKLDEGSGTTAQDSSGFGHAGVLYNSPIWSDNTPTTMDFHDPYSLQFDRSSPNYVLTGSIPRLDQAQTLSLSAWVRLASTPGGSGLTYMRFVTLENEKAVLRYYDDNGAGKLQFYMKIDGSLHFILVDRTWANGTWYHVAGTYDGSTMRLYLNGVEQDTLGVSGTADSGGWMRLSHSSAAEALDGLLDDVRIYDRALTATEISDLAAGKHPQTSVATTTLGAALDVNGDLTLNSGTLDVSTGNYTINLGGDFTRNGGIFTAQGGTVTFDGVITQTLDTDTITFHDLTVNSGATLATRRAFNANGTLTNNGTLQQTRNVVSSGTAFLWAGGYGGLSMGGANLGETTVSIRGNQDCTTTPGETVKRCFDIDTAGTGSTLVQFYFAAAELSGNDCNTLNAYHWNGSGWGTPLSLDTSWGSDGRVCPGEGSAPYSVRVYPVSDFSPFVLKSDSVPTAVTLRDFRAWPAAGAWLLSALLALGALVTTLWVQCGRRSLPRQD